MSVRITRYEAFVEGKKYLHKKGILYSIRDRDRDRESDEDYDPDEKWTFDAWCGPECKDTARKDTKKMAKKNIALACPRISHNSQLTAIKIRPLKK